MDAASLLWMPMAFGLFTWTGCDRSTKEIDRSPPFVYDAWFHPYDANVAANIRFGSNQVFTSNLEGCDASGTGHSPWVAEGRNVRVPDMPGSPLFSYLLGALSSSVPLTFEGQAFDTWVQGALCPVCQGAQVTGVVPCATPLRDGGT